MSDQIWLLRCGRNDPLIWPFQTEEQARDFAIDHGLIDWRADRQDDPEKEHEPICARDREPWPCRHVRVDREARAIIAAAKNTCARCGKPIGWMKVTFRGAGQLGENISYHGRVGACFNEAKRRAAETQDEGALRDIARCEQDRELSRQHREAAAARRGER